MVLKITLGIDRELSCAVCRALIDEVNYSISQVDPKKTIQVGSFRVDSKGNQGTYEKPYARSEVHLMEIFENICDNFRDYAETKNDAGQKSVGRTKARGGKTLALKDIKISADSQKLLKYSCETLLEDHEEEMIALFRRENQPDIEKVICGKVTSRCSEKDLSVPMPVTEVDSLDTLLSEEEEKEKMEGKDDAQKDDMLDEYMKDNTDSIAADTVTNIDHSSTEEVQKEKEEL